MNAIFQSIFIKLITLSVLVFSCSENMFGQSGKAVGIGSFDETSSIDYKRGNEESQALRNDKSVAIKILDVRRPKERKGNWVTTINVAATNISGNINEEDYRSVELWFWPQSKPELKTKLESELEKGVASFQKVRLNGSFGKYKLRVEAWPLKAAQYEISLFQD